MKLVITIDSGSPRRDFLTEEGEEYFKDKNSVDFEVDWDFPYFPTKGDFIDLYEILKQEELKYIDEDNRCIGVNFITWGKSENKIYPQLFLYYTN